MRAAKETIEYVTTKPTTDKQTNNWPTILCETEYLHFENLLKLIQNILGQQIFMKRKISPLKKKRSWSDSNPGPLPPKVYSLLPD